MNLDSIFGGRRRAPARRTGARPSLEYLEGRLAPAVNATWTGAAGDGLWGTAANWDGGVPNGPDDTATFDAASSPCDLDASAGPVTLKQVTITGSYQGTVTLDRPLTVGADGAASRMESGTLQAAFPGDALTITGGTFDWAGGAWTGSPMSRVTVAAGALLDVSGSASQLDVTLDDSGAVALHPDGDLRLGNGAALTVEAGATFDVQGDHGVLDAGATGVQNAGAFLKSAGAGASTIEVPFANTGPGSLVQIATGTLAFKAALAQDGGRITLRDGAALRADAGLTMSGGRLDNLGASTIIGDVTVNGGTVSPGGDGAVGTLYVTGDCRMTAGTLRIDLDNTPGSAGAADQLVVGGTLALRQGADPAGELAVTSLNGPPLPGRAYDILSYGALDGDFAMRDLAGYTSRVTSSTYQLDPPDVTPRAFAGRAVGQEALFLASPKERADAIDLVFGSRPAA